MIAGGRWGTGVVLSVAMGLGLVAGLYELHDPDVWWVAAAGRERLLHGALPTTNLFSFTDPSHPWVMHEWLLAVPYAWMLGRLGPPAFAVGAGSTASGELYLNESDTIVLPATSHMTFKYQQGY